MSRPKPIEYRVRWWTVTYQTQYFESDRTGTYHYQAYISYVAKSDEKSLKSITHEDRKIFTDFDDAKAWIDEELKS